MILYCVRHGETDWNVKKKIQGQTDIPLNPNGVRQAKELAARGLSSKEIASAIKVAPFVAGKYLSQAKYFTTDTVKDILNECADIEERVKQGRLQDKLGVELIIIKYSA